MIEARKAPTTVVTVADLVAGDVFLSFGWEMPCVFIDAEPNGTGHVMLRGRSLAPNGECKDGVYSYRLTPDTPIFVVKTRGWKP